MAGNKKKKKPAANPARGFATTSVASKPKPVKTEDDSETSERPDAAQTGPRKEDSQHGVDEPNSGEKALDELTPEELEQRLETSDLQMLVEKHGPKVRRECSRQTSKVVTELRTLRQQSQTLDYLEWLPPDLLEEALGMAKSETSDHILGNQTNTAASKSLVEEEAMVKLWTLQQMLNDLGFQEERISWVLRKLLTLRSELDANSSVWGFNEALDYLALECDPQELSSYGDPSLFKKRRGDISVDSSRPDTPVESASISSLQNSSQPFGSDNNTRDTSTVTSQAPSVAGQESDQPMSDDDLEPDELLPKYLSLKERLYDIDPDQVPSASSRKGGKGKKGAKPTQTSQNPSKTAQALQRRLRKIESDVLFDQREADYQWEEKRILLAREAANRRRLELPDRTAKADTDSNAPSNASESGATDILGEAAALGEELLAQKDDTEEGGLLGGMFAAESDDGAALPTATGLADGTPVAMRTFGKVSGLSPRRILEEACRARDSAAKVAFKHVSPTTYASQHSVTVVWSKDQDVFPFVKIPSISSTFSLRSFTFTMTGVATPDTQQSESYVATAALFLIFSNSPKEEKAYLRLPATWRELWFEFAELKKEQIDADDREMVKNLRALVRHQREVEEEEGVVLTKNFKKRDEGKNGPSSDAVKQASTNIDGDHLRQLWSKKCSSPAFRKMLESRRELPMFQFRDAALDSIANNQVTILCGETGCGKSTQLPSFILEHELSQGRDCKIYCTEPRRISAISLAQRVSEEIGEPKKDLGTSRSLIGYAIRLESNTSASTRLVYATVGIVLRMLESSRGLDDITHLILDEVHERSIDTDFLLVILRSLMERRPELKVVLMSATVDAQRFSKYLDNAPIITVPGRTYPVNTRYLEDAVELTQHKIEATGNQRDTEDDDIDEEPSNERQAEMAKSVAGYSSATRNYLLNFDEYRIDYELIIKLIKTVSSNPEYVDFSKAILVFLPGMGEIRQLNDLILDDPDFGKGWVIHPLHSTIASEDQQQAFVVPPSGTRKIVLATNIAETGITIPDVTCVIDSGMHREMRFDERRQLSRLIQAFISKANAKQRRGRAGRVQEGLCFHLFTRYRHDNLMADQQTPEMLRLSLQDLVMRVKICKLGEIEETLSQALDPPSSRNIRRAIDALVDVDALTAAEELTPLGRQIAKLPLDASLGKLVLLGSIFTCLDATLTIAAILSSKSPFNTPIGAKQRADAARLGFKRSDSDLLTAYNAYVSWRRICTTGGTSEFAFCKKNFLNAQNLANIEDLKSQLLASLVDAGFVTLSPDERHALRSYRSSGRRRTFVATPPAANRTNDNDVLTSAVIAWAFYPKLLIRDGRGWRNLVGAASVSLHFSSINNHSPSLVAKHLSYYHILQTATGARVLHAHATTPANPVPLLLLAGDADFRLHAGVVLLDGARLRLAGRDWKPLVALKALRLRLREVVAALLRNPDKPLSRRLEKWRVLVFRMFEEVGSAAERR